MNTTSWRELAKSGKLEDAVEAYIREMDWVTFAELQRQFAPFMGVRGDWRFGFLDNLVVWAGMSEEFMNLVLSLAKAGRVHYWSSTAFTYIIDGECLTLPVAKRAQAYKHPHWLPVTLRTIPNPGETRKTGKRVAKVMA